MPESPGLQPLAAKASADGTLSTVYRRAQRLASLRNVLAAALPSKEAAHLVGVSDAGFRLVVFADSAAWATRLRYRTPDLEHAVRKVIGAKPHLVFRTLPAGETAPQPSRRSLSPRAREVLQSAARTVRDSELAAALRRLAGS